MSEIKCKVEVKKGGDKSKMVAKLFAVANSLNKRRRKLQKKRKKSNILLLHILKRKRKCCLQKLLMQIVVHTQIAKNVLVNRSCRRFERSCGWWRNVWNTYSDERFGKNFPITRGTFAYINEKMQHLLIKDIIAEDPIYPE